MMAGVGSRPTRAKRGDHGWSRREVQVLSVPGSQRGHAMPFSQRGSMLGSILGILLCGVAGGFVAWSAVTAWGIDGVFGAVVATVTGMVVATALWAAGSSLLRALGWVR